MNPSWPLVVLATVIFLGAGWIAVRGRSWRPALAAALIGVACLGVRVGGQPEPPAPVGIDIVLVIDRTTSMGAQDYTDGAPRVAGVAADVDVVLAALPAARYVVVTMDNQARVAVPWTTDTAAVSTFGHTLGWREESYGQGSDISEAEPLAHELLSTAARERPHAARYLIYFGDGEQTSTTPPRSFSSLRPLLTGAKVLGYGTEQGGRMAVRPDVDDLVIRDGSPQLSRIDEAALRRIAAELGGDYSHRPGSLAVWEAPATLPSTRAAAPGWQPTWWLALLAAGLLGWELWRTTRAVRVTKEDLE